MVTLLTLSHRNVLTTDLFISCYSASVRVPCTVPCVSHSFFAAATATGQPTCSSSHGLGDRDSHSHCDYFICFATLVMVTVITDNSFKFKYFHSGWGISAEQLHTVTTSHSQAMVKVHNA